MTQTADDIICRAESQTSEVTVYECSDGTVFDNPTASLIYELYRMCESSDTFAKCLRVLAERGAWNC